MAITTTNDDSGLNVPAGSQTIPGPLTIQNNLAVTGYITDAARFNVRNYGAAGNGITDDTAAFRAAILAAAQANYLSGVTSDGSGPEVLIPPGEYVISNDLPVNTLTVTNGGQYVNIRGIGHPVIRQTDATKDIFVWTLLGGLSGNYDNVIDGITFYGGRRQISASNGLNDGARFTIRDCTFRNSADYAIFTDMANSFLHIENPRFFNCAKVLQNVTHAGLITGGGLSNSIPTTPNNVALIYNGTNSVLTMRDFKGSPNLSSTNNVRWIDNYGNGLLLDGCRFGGEGATSGIPIVYHFAALDATNGFTYPTRVIVRGCDIAGGHTNANAAVVNLRTDVPQLLIIEGNSFYNHTPPVAKNAALNFATYFAGLPSSYRWNWRVEPNGKWFNENTDVIAAPDPVPIALIPYLTGFVASAKTIHVGGIPATSATPGTDSTPVNTEFYFGEIEAVARTLVTGVSVFNGSVASGNMKVGLFHSFGILVATSASTVMAGTNTYQRIPFTGKYLISLPGTYYVGVFIDNSTARIRTHAVGDFGTGKATTQVYATGFTAITAPTTFTANLGPIASLY